MKDTFKIKHPIRFALLCLFVVFPIFFVGSLAVNGYQAFMPMFNALLIEGNELIESIDENTFNKREDTQIYDCNDELISEINVTNYQYVPITQISPYLMKGYVAVEDRNFYEHHGVDPKAIARVVVSLVLNRGQITQGGSTITQQVLKNNLITDKSTVERKIIEILIAGKLEDKLTKEQIMEAYCNTNPILQAELQKDLDKALSPYQEKGDDGFYELQGAAVTVDNRTGYVVAIVGGREGKGEFNRGYQAVRQPGSAIKPLIVYTPAFETGNYYPSKVMEDKYIEDGPGNAYSGYKGRMDLYEALARSTNTIAYQIFLDIGANYGSSYLAAMDFSHMSYLDQNNGSLALGGFTYGVSVDEMAKGYATLANQGYYSQNTCIKQIKYRNTGVIFEATNKTDAVFLPDTTYMTIDMMKGVLTESYGTGRTKSLLNAIAAAKTGTTDGGRDVWFCGSTAYYSTAVWVGYDIPKSNQGLSSSYPGKVWQEFMTYLHQDLPVTDFSRPDTIVEHPIDSNGDPSYWNSYRTGIFSSVIEERKETEQMKKEERERQEQEEKRKLELDKEISSLENG